jgi:DHA1 family bicyclomycin/chloramphenicol resistance-like MFS transporter
MFVFEFPCPKHRIHKPYQSPAVFMQAPAKSIPVPELIVLLAMMMSIVALSIDSMLPALDAIGNDLKVANPNDNQLVITSLFLGFAVGQLLAGPLSDNFGRKPVIYVGYTIFIIGCLLSIFASSFTMMLIGRVLQGIGAASPRTVTVALARDLFEGRTMARIMSFVMAVFILVPMIAPAIGLAITTFWNWQAIFSMLMVMAILSNIWFAIRQPETLPAKDRLPFSFKSLALGTKEVMINRKAIGYTVTAGLIFGAFIGYISVSQQIFQVVFNTGEWFAFYFGLSAVALGLASIVNAGLVLRLGMRLLTIRAFIAATILSVLFILPVYFSQGVPAFWLFVTWLGILFFCIGLTFGNLNALAMEPLGHVAGIGAALIGFFSTMIALPLAWAIGYFFDSTVYSLVIGFAVLSAFSVIVIMWTEAAEQ